MSIQNRIRLSLLRLQYFMLVTLHEKDEVHFRTLGTPGLTAKADNERFTAVGSRCRLSVTSENIHIVIWQAKSLFTWKESAPANRATWLEGLKQSPLLHATHLTRIVSGLRGLSVEWPLSSTIKVADPLI